MDIPKISVIIPAFKAEKYIERAIESLIQSMEVWWTACGSTQMQTSPAAEIIVVLDGEEPVTEAIIKRVAEERPQFKQAEPERVEPEQAESEYATSDRVKTEEVKTEKPSPLSIRCVSQEHKGVSAARNRGLEEAGGEYIFFMDADDTIEEEFLNRLISFAEENNSDWVACNYRIMADPTDGTVEKPKEAILAPAFPAEIAINGDRGERVNPEPAAGYSMADVQDHIFAGPEDNILSSAAIGIYRRSAILNSDIRFKEGLAYGEDMVFNYELVHHIRSFGYIPEPLYNYIINKDSITASTLERNLLDHKIKLLTAVEEVRKKYGDPYSNEYLSFGAIQIRQVFQFDILRRESRIDRKSGYEDFDEAAGEGSDVFALWSEIGKNYRAPKLTHRIFFSLLTKGRYGIIELLQPLAKKMMAPPNNLLK